MIINTSKCTLFLLFSVSLCYTTPPASLQLAFFCTVVILYASIFSFQQQQQQYLNIPQNEQSTVSSVESGGERAVI